MISFDVALRVFAADGSVTKTIHLTPRVLLGLAANFFRALCRAFLPGDYQEALRLFKNGDLNGAEAMATKVVARRPSLAAAHALLGRIHAKRGHWQAAHTHVSKAIKIQPRNGDFQELHDSVRLRYELLERHQPQVVLYVAGMNMNNVGYHVNMWIPVLEKLDVRTAIILRQSHLQSSIMPTSVPLYCLPSLRDLELLQQAKVRTVLYPGNSSDNVHMLRFHKMKHFFINHGESDKCVNQNRLMLAYNKLLVAGPLAKARLRKAGINLQLNQAIEVGRPNLELLLDQETDFPREPKVVLYAPTWEGIVDEADYSSVSSFGARLLHRLAGCGRVKVVFKAHPRTGTARKTTHESLQEMLRYCRSHGFEVVAPASDIYPHLNRADVLITDISSLINEFLYTRKPVILTNPDLLPHDKMVGEYPSARGAYILDSPDSIGGILEHIATEDGKFKDRLTTSAYTLGRIPEGSFNRFNRVILESLADENHERQMMDSETMILESA
jgi:tetratricopeptide (TPR) repeat protein